MKTKFDYYQEAAHRADDLIRKYKLDVDTRRDLIATFKRMKVPMRIEPKVEFKFFTEDGILQVPNRAFFYSPCNRVTIIYQYAERWRPKDVIPAWSYGIQMAFAHEFLIPFSELRDFLEERPHATPLDVADYFLVSSLFAAERMDKFEEEVSK